VKPLSAFFNSRTHHNRRCRDCTNKANRASYRRNKATIRIAQRSYEQRVQERARAGDKLLHAKSLLAACRTRSRRLKIPCTITPADIPVPEFCPVFGVPLVLNRGCMAYNSATVDRIDPSLGYVPGNVIVVSSKANAIKHNATAAEILKVGMFYAQIGVREVS
jgi:hypothetical protein